MVSISFKSNFSTSDRERETRRSSIFIGPPIRSPIHASVPVSPGESLSGTGARPKGGKGLYLLAEIKLLVEALTQFL